MPDTKTQRRAKQGVHGWRAFFLMFGCGTTAALAVVGVIVLVLRGFVGAVQAGPDASPRDVPAGATGSPQASLEPGKLDVCSTTIPTISKISVSRVDSDDDYVDTAQEEDGPDGRVVSDHCEFKMTPDYASASQWDFTFSYRAYIPSSGGGDPVGLALDEFEELQQRIESGFSLVENKGEGGYADRSFFVYGYSEGSQNMTAYLLLAQTSSAVYEVGFNATSERGGGSLVPQAAFEHEVDEIIERMEVNFGLWIPE